MNYEQLNIILNADKFDMKVIEIYPDKDTLKVAKTNYIKKDIELQLMKIGYMK